MFLTVPKYFVIFFPDGKYAKMEKKHLVSGNVKEGQEVTVKWEDEDVSGIVKVLQVSASND